MVRLHYQGGIFDFPRKRRRLAWYVEQLCSRLMQLDEIGEDSIKGFWDEIAKKQQVLRFPWQRENLGQEAKERLNNLLSGYQYDAKTRVYTHK